MPTDAARAQDPHARRDLRPRRRRGERVPRAARARRRYAGGDPRRRRQRPLLEELLDEGGVPRRTVPIAGRTRVSHTVHDSRPAGIPLRPRGPGARRGRVAGRAGRAGAARQAAGSSPAAACRAACRRISTPAPPRIAARRGRRFVLDTSGARCAPRWAMASRSSSRAAASSRRWSAGSSRRPRRRTEAARGLVREGAAELVAVTLGHEGAMLAEPGGVTAPAGAATCRRSARSAPATASSPRWSARCRAASSRARPSRWAWRPAPPR